MQYKNMLSLLHCNRCNVREACFLQRMPLQKYPEETQSFVIHLPANIFVYNVKNHRWYAQYLQIEKHIIEYYDSHDCVILENSKFPLSTAAQKDSDRQFIREKFKHFLEIAAKATEDTDTEASIIFDGIGLVLASDYLEAVQKTLSMFSKFDKMIETNETACPLYSHDS